MAGFSNAATCALLLPLLIFSYHPTPAVSFSLNFPEFTTAERKDIKIEGDASFIGNASMGSIDMSANLYGSVSRASYNTQPVQLWDKAAGKVASFTTRFEFLMSSGSNDEVGMAFFLAGYPSSLPAGGTVHSLGLTDQNADSVASGDSRFVAVAFDTFNNPMASDPTASYDYDHIGIYVNSLRSVSTLKLQGSTLTSGTLILSVIEYDNVSNVLAVTLWDQDQQSYYLNSKVDLKSALPEQVSIGFSASTSSGEDKQKNGGVFRLVEWVWGLYGRGSILEAADERLNGDYDAAEVETVMVVGLWCAHPNPSVRPSIRTAMATLQPKVDQAYQLPVLPSKMPVPMYEPAPPLSWANVVGMSSSSSHTIGMSSSTSSSMPLHTSCTTTSDASTETNSSKTSSSLLKHQ
ncbi:unnamed protein product [Triticum turgidum subsp. durum]|uniref:Legume lectin domain-containing protein n=1 Tax=Triticum turgidum subsp. durum TaxID=4567 RepID=A0A9R1P9K8_TRITD|nr:unnamed protein product [Triticum turgidum subsp. durum]